MLFEKLTLQDQNMLDDYIAWYGTNQYSSLYRNSASLEYRMRYWDAAKTEYLYRLFGEQFILEKEVSYKVPIRRLENEISKSVSWGKMSKFATMFEDFVREHYPDFFCHEAYCLRDLCCSYWLSRNSCNPGSTMAIPFGDKVIKFQDGSKPIRILSKFAKMMDKEAQRAFEDFRLEHSRILNQKDLTGTLCLSIHPLDYLTMSENNSSWTSCMNWTEPGCYRMGTVEMMNSPMVVVAYLKSDTTEYKFGRHSWSNKHWRSLFIVDTNGIMSIKNYPYHSEELTRACCDWLRDLAFSNMGWTFGPVEPIKIDEVFLYPWNNKRYKIEPETGAMYNDFGTCEHFGCFSWDGEVFDDEEPIEEQSFCYSGVTECMWCGENASLHIYDESYVFCDGCCSYADDNCSSCEQCGDYYDNDELYWVGDNCYCSNCIGDVAAEDVISGEYYYYEDLATVYLAMEADKPNPDRDAEVFMDRVYAEKNGRYFEPALTLYYRNWFEIDNPRYDEEQGIYYFNRDDMTLAGLRRIFCIYDADNYFD